MQADRDRFEALFVAHYAAVVRYAVRRVGADAAPEVVSETFLVAWRRLADVPPNALPWLFATARRIAANELRRQRRARAFTETLAGRAAPEPVDPADAIDARLRVRAALAGMSERDREVLRLQAWEQLAPADAARVLGCTTAAYKVRLHRARRRLAALLGDAQPVGRAATPQEGLS